MNRMRLVWLSITSLSLVAAAQESASFRRSIERTVAAHRDDLRVCYEERLLTKPELAGAVEVVLTVNAAGQVTSSKHDPAQTTIDDPELIKCLTRAIRGWKFPRSTGEPVTVSFPLVFVVPPEPDAGVAP